MSSGDFPDSLKRTDISYIPIGRILPTEVTQSPVRCLHMRNRSGELQLSLPDVVHTLNDLI